MNSGNDQGTEKTCCRCSAVGQVFSKYSPLEGAEPVPINWTCVNCGKHVCINCVLTEGTAPVMILDHTLCSEECRAEFDDDDADVSALPSDLYATISRGLEEEGQHGPRIYDSEPRPIYIDGGAYQQLVALAQDAGVRPDAWVEALIAKAWLEWKGTLT